VSTRTRKAERIDCAGITCGLEPCKGHTVEIHYNNTSDTVSLHVDGEHCATFCDPVWSAIAKLDKEDDELIATSECKECRENKRAFEILTEGVPHLELSIKKLIDELAASRQRNRELNEQVRELQGRIPNAHNT